MIKALQIQHNEIMEKMFSYAKEAGFSYISLGFGSSKLFHSDDWKEEILKIKKKLDEFGLSCIQTHLPYYNLLISAEEKDEAMEEAIKHCIKATGMLGAKYTAFHPRSSVNYDCSAIRSFKENKKDIESYIPVAKESGVIIALENLPIFPGIPKHRFYSWHYDDLCFLADSLNSENIGICWDFGHAHLTGINHETALEVVGKRLVCTHIHNNFEDSDRHLLPDAGNIEWEKLMDVLKKTDYRGPLTLEVDYKESKSLKSFVCHSYSCITQLEELMEG